jgi:Lrp/AsnC family transcriptional regulator for asnA, asnC and gidA
LVTTPWLGVYLDKAARNLEAVKELKKIPEVLECHYTTGNWSILIKIICKDNQHLMNLLNTKIQTIEGVSRTETFSRPTNRQTDSALRATATVQE